jgi:hypothetical protein
MVNGSFSVPPLLGTFSIPTAKLFFSRSTDRESAPSLIFAFTN